MFSGERCDADQLYIVHDDNSPVGGCRLQTMRGKRNGGDYEDTGTVHDGAAAACFVAVILVGSVASSTSHVMV